ncbi:MAG: SIMPL domain-containing protein [Haloarculaceae archaeon]
MERKLTAVVLASVMLLSVLGATGAGTLAAANHAANTAANTAGNAATVSASATGEVTAQPDRAVVHLTVSADGSNASEATDALDADVSMLRRALDDENLSVQSVRTTGLAVREGGDAGYVASQAFAVTTDADAVGDVVDVAFDSGADEVTATEFTLSPERERALQREAIERAVANARFQAEVVANSTGLTLAGVHSVSVSGVSDASAMLRNGTAVAPEPVTVSATVAVTYNATGS